jgi:hypothetical protein
LAEELESGVGGLVRDRGEHWVGERQRGCRHGEFWWSREDRWYTAVGAEKGRSWTMATGDGCGAVARGNTVLRGSVGG